MEGLVAGADCKADNLLLRQLAQRTTASLVRIWRCSRQHRHLTDTTHEQTNPAQFI